MKVAQFSITDDPFIVMISGAKYVNQFRLAEIKQQN